MVGHAGGCTFSSAGGANRDLPAFGGPTAEPPPPCYGVQKHHPTGQPYGNFVEPQPHKAAPSFRNQYARAREGCMKLPMVATACYQKSWFKRALLPTAHPGFSEQYARAREVQPDLKSKWVRLPTGFGRQLKTEPSIPTTAHSPCCWQMLAPRLNFQPSMARGWISNLTHRPG